MVDASAGAATRAEIFFDSTLQRFRDLEASPGATVSRHIALAGRTIRIEVSAGAMERAIMSGLAHLVCPPRSEPDLTIFAWDSASTGTPPISPGWRPDEYGREGFVNGFNDDRYHTATRFDPIILRMLDMERRQAIYWIRAASTFPVWELGAPMRPLLHEWLRRIGLVAVHGGAVGRADGGVFLAGAGGQGKSNIALACLNSELFYASDDFCVLSRSPDWIVHSLYCTGKVAEGDLVRHPYLHDQVSNPHQLDDEKALFFLNDKFGDRIVRAMPLRAIVLPRVVGRGQSALAPADPAVALKTIALSTFELSRWTGPETFAKVSELVRDLPCYELQVGGALPDVPVLLARLLDDLA